MYPNDEKKVAFLAWPRTASQAVGQYLVNNHGFRAEGKHHSVPGSYRPSWTYFTIVRNHFDAFASWYFTFQGQAQRKKDIITVDWLRTLVDKRLKNNYFREPGLMWPLAKEPVELVWYEKLDEDLAVVLEPFGIETSEVPVVNRGQWRKGTPYYKIFSPDARAFVEHRFGDEMERLGYSYEEG